MPRPPVVVVHGLFSTAVTNLPVHRTLRERGFETFDVPIPGLNTQDPHASARDVHATVERVLGAGSARAHLVGVSLGGVIGLAYLQAFGGSRIHRFVGIGAPFQGTRMGRLGPALARVAGFLDAPHTLGLLAVDSAFVHDMNARPVDGTEVYAVWHPADPMVPPPGATLPWATNVRAPVGRFPTAHHQLLLDARNRRLVADLLDHGASAVPRV